MISGHDAKSYLGAIIESIDNGQTPKRPTSPWWVRHVAVPTALGISLSLSSCATDPDAQDISKLDAAEAKADGWTGDLCAEIGEDEDCDVCGIFGWYGDGECDDFCAEEDTADCSATMRYMAPMPEVCDDGFDNDSDGRFDCNDSDCSADAACQATARYMAPLAEDCDDDTDNDGDGDIDCEDDECYADANCRPTPRYMGPLPEQCDDGVDNEGDGDIDCADDDCDEDPACQPTTRYMAPMPEDCDDDIDNDRDGDVDCDDSDCSEDAACAPSARYMAPFGE